LSSCYAAHFELHGSCITFITVNTHQSDAASNHSLLSGSIVAELCPRCS